MHKIFDEEPKMTAHEELTYLFGILSEASKWASANDDPDSVRMEVEYRIRNFISGVAQEPDNLPAEEENLTGSDYQANKSSKLNSHLPDPDKAAKAVNEWRSKRVRCQENGHPVWHLRSECVKEPRDNRNGGPRWTWKWIGPQDKKAQEEEAMWAEHEAGNAELQK